MDRAFFNIPTNYQRYLFVFAVMVFVLLLSCPVKSSIKSLFGVPTNTEHASKKSGVLGSGSEQCVVWEASGTKITQTPSKVNDLLPVIVLTAVFLFLCNLPHTREQAHCLYDTLKITGTLPIFLQYRKLII